MSPCWSERWTGAAMGVFADIGLGEDMQYAAREAIARRLRLADAEKRHLELEPG
jgi:hypothetical protein